MLKNLNGEMQQSSYKKVRPEPINEKSLYGSVVDFLHDVVIDKVPQTLIPTTVASSSTTSAHNVKHQNQNTTHHSDLNEIKEPIEWLHFENIKLMHKSCQNQQNLLLILGYKTGFQLWLIDINGVATEVLNVKESQIVNCKLIKYNLDDCVLLAKCKYVSNLHYSIEIVALAILSNNTNGNSAGTCLHNIDYYGHIIEMKSNQKFLLISGYNANGQNQLDAFDLHSRHQPYEHVFTINTCYVSPTTPAAIPSKYYNPFALGTRWLAFADNKFHIMFNSQGGMSNGVEQSYTATVLNTAKNISKGLVKISESVVNTVVLKASKLNSTDAQRSVADKENIDTSSSSSSSPPSLASTSIAGVCTIIDTIKFARRHKPVHDESQNWIVAHFIAHQEAIYALEFNQSGRLLITADTLGQYFNVYLVNSNPFKSTRTYIRHLYSLYRGDTTAKVDNINFSYDSRWVAVSTKRGTTHLFPINSYGGPVNSRTHTNPYVVNRSSKHSRTAGFTDDENQSQPPTVAATSANNTNNPKIRNLMEPFVIQALGQIRQPYTTSSSATHNLSTLTVNAVDNAITSLANSTNLMQVETVHVASIFADTRGYLSPEEPRDFAKNRLKPVSSLFVISNLNGNLNEYVLDANISKANNIKRTTNDAPIQLKIQPKAQWPLQRAITCNEMKYKLKADNPLLHKYDEQQQQHHVQVNNYNNNDWIKMVEISTHLGPHRRLFMGPQFLFKTINTTTTMLNANSSALMDNNTTPLIDFSNDIELNSLDLTKNYRSSPMPIPAYLSNNVGYNSSPAHIDVGPGSYQEEMPIFNKKFNTIGCISSSYESQKSESACGIEGDLIETLADAMNDLSGNGTGNGCGGGTKNFINATPAITIIGKSHRKESVTVQSPTSYNAQSNGFYVIQDRCDSRMGVGSVGGGGSSGGCVGSNIPCSGVLIGSMGGCVGDDDSASNSSSTHSSLKSSANAPSLENIQFQDDNLLN